MKKIITILLLLSLCLFLSAQTNYFTSKEFYASVPSSIYLRYLLNNVLEKKCLLQKGDVFKIDLDQDPLNYDYRDDSGKVVRSSSGFYTKILIISANNLNDQVIAECNSTLGGLFVDANFINSLNNLDIDPVSESNPQSDYLLSYYSNGKPKFSYTTSFKKRFGNKLNLRIDPKDLSPELSSKWWNIYQELLKIGDRTKTTERILLFLDNNTLANKYSIQFETTGEIYPFGAWSVAVLGTAKRHGFANVPCAEFMSEVIRQAYTRAGYSILDDFNNTRGNYLIYKNTAAVVNLATALYKAGWVPWDSSEYVPMAGAIMMHAQATSPGHTYLVAGREGSLVLDNGSPKGRDLHNTSTKLIKMMYQNGVFFLPPTIIPSKW